jgi:hypothetical protein
MAAKRGAGNEQSPGRKAREENEGGTGFELCTRRGAKEGSEEGVCVLNCERVQEVKHEEKRIERRKAKQSTVEKELRFLKKRKEERTRRRRKLCKKITRRKGKGEEHNCAGRRGV